jgi:hypothetical protein
MAQIYNHMIMPLANSRDRATQILWGIRDFEHRFRRAPEGMWLPETAVDLETLELLARFGMRFIVLAPHQAARVRRIGESGWHDVNGARIDPRQPYRQQLPSGNSIAVFFYDGPIARAVAFEGLLSHGERFLERLIGAFDADREEPQLVHIATDGETYGHHHRFGDMALAYVLEQIETRGLARLTNYGEYLARHPPTHDVEVVEKSSWSCAHGVDRWWSACGCNTGARPGWNQKWRTPLRNALDGLRDETAAAWEEQARRLLKNPWSARDDYIEVVLERTDQRIDNFFARHALAPLDPPHTSAALKLLELQRHAMLMYTSCGWFFDDLAGIETVQILQFAGRAVQLAQELFGDSLEERFVRRLADAASNRAEEGDGARIYDRRVRPARVEWHKLAAHYALSNLFEEFADRASLYCYEALRGDYQVLRAGRAKFGVGRLDLRSTITLETARLMFAALHLGDHNLSGSVADFVSDEDYRQMHQSTVECFTSGDLAAVVREMERRFGDSHYSLRSLFRDEQRKVAKTILAANLAEAEALYRQIYEPREPLLRFLTDLGIPLPKGFAAAADVVINTQLRDALEQTPIDLKRVLALSESARAEGIALETTTLEFAYRQTLERLAAAVADDPSLLAIEQLHEAASVVAHLPFGVDLWQVQNLYFQWLTREYPLKRQAERAGDHTVRGWLTRFQELGRLLRVRVPE